jgi:hypothetical protein
MTMYLPKLFYFFEIKLKERGVMGLQRKIEPNKL